MGFNASRSGTISSSPPDNFRLVQSETICRPQNITSMLLKNCKLLWDGWKTLREWEKMPITSIFSFSHNVFKRLFFFFLRSLKVAMFGKELTLHHTIRTLDYPERDSFNPFPNKPWFLRVYSTSLLKTLWEKGEIAPNEQFLLFPQCFLPV